MREVYLNDIISFLGDDVILIYGNPDGLSVRYVKGPQEIDEHALDWISADRIGKQQIAENSAAKAIVVDPEIQYLPALELKGKILIVMANPKLAIAKIIQKYFAPILIPQIHPTAVVHPEAEIGKNAYIGPNVVIGKCRIGDNVIIFANSYLAENIIIENDVEIHSGVSIGNEAHNFVKDNGGALVKFPHIGKVIIKDHVVIGSNTVISRGVLGDTIIESGVKIAQQVFIGANNVIGRNCAIRPNVMTSGSVHIGKETIIAPSVTIRDHCSVGEKCLIGMGSVVTKNVPSGETWFGNPAKKKYDE